MSTQVYLSTSPRKNCWRFVPLSRMISARSTNSRIVDAQGPALAADVVLRLVEAVAAEVADRAQRPAVVEGVDPLGGVLDDRRSCFPAIAMMRSISQPTPA